MHQSLPTSARRCEPPLHEPALPSALAYPDALIGCLAELLGLSYRVPVLDLASAEGALALAFAPFARHVTALVTTPHEAERLTLQASRQRARLRIVEGTLHDLDPALGRHRLATWEAASLEAVMQALPVLDALIDDGGALALFRTRRLATSPWTQLLPSDRGDARAERDALEALLLASPFEALSRSAIVTRRRTSIEALVATLPQDAADAARHALAAHADGEGALEEAIECEALVARRPRVPSRRS